MSNNTRVRTTSESVMDDAEVQHGSASFARRARTRWLSSSFRFGLVTSCTSRAHAGPPQLDFTPPCFEIWMEVLEKKGLHQVAGILENYGIDCETDVSLLHRDDFSKLGSNGLKPMEGKKLEHWCNAVRARADNMLTSS